MNETGVLTTVFRLYRLCCRFSRFGKNYKLIHRENCRVLAAVINVGFSFLMRREPLFNTKHEDNNERVILLVFVRFAKVGKLSEKGLYKGKQITAFSGTMPAHFCFFDIYKGRHVAYALCCLYN